MDGEAVVGGPPPRAARQSAPGVQEAPERERKPVVDVPSRESPGQDARSEQQPEPAKKYPPPRLYPDLVTEDPAPDDAEVYGEAWPLVEEWRQLWKVHVRPGKGLEWLRRDERILELEVVMLDEHRLTLPPATFPQRGVWRHGQLSWRWKALQDAQRARAWGEVRRGRAGPDLWAAAEPDCPHGADRAFLDAWLTEGRDAASAPSGPPAQSDRRRTKAAMRAASAAVMDRAPSATRRDAPVQGRGLRVQAAGGASQATW